MRDIESFYVSRAIDFNRIDCLFECKIQLAGPFFFLSFIDKGFRKIWGTQQAKRDPNVY